ncbi:2-keto-4-pentenoate hydratase [Sphingomonas aracearum]|uniref:2-keto-4-pentenoate hydratase n=2 Tax=Sphingomonas aracearum TaxID=2283317 RepID=A0A369W5Q7_9SPHN|nr:2-keto-4-pentenoate hydratase [Sphingomonas aracearum]
MAHSEAADIAARLVAARRAAQGLGAYPGTAPRTLAEGYAIQALAIDLRGGEIGGWKIGRIADPLVADMGANRLAGPIFADRIVTAGESGSAEMSVIADGFGAAEAEFLLQLGDLPTTLAGEWTIERARSVVRRVAIGIEIASSPLRAINDLGPAVTVSDFGNNNGLLIGPELEATRADMLDAIDVRLTIDGELAGQATTATMLDGPYGAVRFLLELAGRIGLPVRAGQWISTGAVTGVHRIAPGSQATAWFDDAQITATIVAVPGAR